MVLNKGENIYTFITFEDNRSASDQLAKKFK
ncbi:hypothetical protein ETSB_1565 [cyanobacterium endosymbiont of Epithemia turgida isolate EtSB Lake Yunoko]|jgi:hypothetical protein|nr:hypothetical protein ETSB_1565 [cyanobacterium endosymbiont of Epithemia turgida isolate EtSB Lake Yunoko]